MTVEEQTGIAAIGSDRTGHVAEPKITRVDGGMYRLTATTMIDRPVTETFEFFADAANLDEITPPWLRFRIVTPTPFDMREGQLLDYRLRIHGFPVGWRSRIENWEPGKRFTDVQVKGPYRLWRHLHRFTELEANCTLVEDEVTYRVPGGLIMHRLFVRRDLLRIFHYRQQKLAELLNGAGTAS